MPAPSGPRHGVAVTNRNDGVIESDDLAAAMNEFQRCCEECDVAAASVLLHDEYAPVLVHPAEIECRALAG
jgi:hypothetical protein